MSNSKKKDQNKVKLGNEVLCVIAIKKYCESQPTCQKCQFKEENGTEHMCALYGCPNEWEVESGFER